MRKNASDGVDYSRVSVSTYIHMWVFGMVLVLLTLCIDSYSKIWKGGRWHPEAWVLCVVRRCMVEISREVVVSA